MTYSNYQGQSLSRASAPAVGASFASVNSGNVANFGGLGKNTKTVDQSAKTSAKHQKTADEYRGIWASKKTAAHLLDAVKPAHAKRVGFCGYVAFAEQVTLGMNAATGKAHFGGVMRCGSTWCCPVCSSKIGAKRKDELDALMIWARAKGYTVALLTFTFSHKKNDALADILDALKAAKKRLGQRREWRALPVVGSVTATEVTHGANGFHPHLHQLVILDAAPAAALAALETLRNPWLACLSAYGLTGNARAFDVQDGSQAGAYIAKFAAASEVALQRNKQGRAGSRSPWQLLEDARDGCKLSARLWREYAAAFMGKRQLVWSRGLKSLVGLDEISDEQAAEDEPQEIHLLRCWTRESWRSARRRLCSLLYAAESGGCLDAAEFGETDREKWRRYGGGSLIEVAA